MSQALEYVTDWRTALSNATLFSFRICPFVARAQIVANLKNVTPKTVYIDLANKPAWFLQLSPTGTVPAMQIDGRFIFESAVIADLIDAVTGEELYPQEPLAKFENRSWIEYASTVIRSQYMMIMARSEDAFESQKQSLSRCLGKVEVAIVGAPFFNGAQISMVDAAYAPVLHRLLYLKKHYGVQLLDDYPIIRRWAEAVTEHPSVASIHDDEFNTALLEHMRSNSAVLVSGASASIAV